VASKTFRARWCRQDVGHQFFDIGPDRCRSSGEPDVVAKEAAHADRRFLVLRDADAADHAACTDDSDRLPVGGHVADGLDDHVRAVTARQVADLGDAFVAAGGDDVGGAELPAQIGAVPVASHEDDLLGAESPG